MRSLWWLIRAVVIRRAFRRWPATMLATAAVALAGASFVSVVTASRASVAAFSDTVGGSGLTELRFRGGKFDPAEISEWLQAVYGSFEIVPILEGSARLPSGAEIAVIGTDLGTSGESPEGKLFVTRAVSEIPVSSLPLEIPMNGALRTFSAVSLLEGDGTESRSRALFADIATLQQRLGLGSVVSWIGLKARGSREASQLPPPPPGFYLLAEGERATQARVMLAAFELNISVMVLMTLLVCGILILNTVQLSAMAGQGEISTLRALGVSTRETALLVLSEGALLGMAGSLCGLLFGKDLAERLAASFLDTAGSLYFDGSATGNLQLFDSPWPILLGVAAGIGISIAGAGVPAWQASKIPPVLAARSLHTERRIPLARGILLGALSLGATFIAALLALKHHSQLLAQLSAVGVIAGVIALSPVFLAGCLRLFRAYASRSGRAVILLGQALSAAKPRAASLVCVVSGLALALLLGLGVMVGSFRKTLEGWIHHTIQADLFIRAPDRGVFSSAPMLPAPALDAIATVPGISFVSRYLKSDEIIEGRPMTVAGTDLGYLLDRGVYTLLSGRCSNSDLASGNALIISEVAERKLDRHPGDSIQVFGERFSICGVISDFASQSGSVLLDRSVYQRLSGAAPIFSSGVYLSDPATKEDVRIAAEKILGAEAIVVDNAELRARILETFDRTFAVTEVIRILLFLMALGAVFVSMVQLLWSQSGEIREFRVIGGSSGQVYFAISVAAAEIAIAAGASGIAGGLALAFVLIEVINPVSFGWTLTFHPGTKDFLIPLGAIIVGMLGVALIAGRYLRSSWNALGLRPLND